MPNPTPHARDQREREMTLYELINPSDAHTFYAESDEVAHLTASLISGMYFAKRCDGAEIAPYPADPHVILDSRLPAIANALETMVVGTSDVGSRGVYESELAKQSPDSRDRWLAEWEDRKRSSLNRIQRYATNLAAKIRARAAIQKAGA